MSEQQAPPLTRNQAIDALFDLFDSDVVVEAAVGAILDRFAARVSEPGLDELRTALAEWDAIEGSDLSAQFRAFTAAGKMATAIRAALTETPE